MNTLTTLLGLTAYGCLGIAYLTWRARPAGAGAPMGLLRHLNDRAENDPEAAPIRQLPFPAIVALASAAYVTAVIFWPYLAGHHLIHAAKKR